MSATNNGGPAFPVPLNPGQSWQGMAPCDGMTLRDYFAAKAMQGLVSGCAGAVVSETRPLAAFAGIAYALADAMLKAREAQQ
jgi:hypothetical protein